MRNLSYLLAMAFPISIFGQTITDADIMPPLYQLPVHMSAYEASDSGANMTWDYSNLVIDSSYVMSIDTPGVAPHSVNFPLANKVEIRSGYHPYPKYVFHEVNADGWYEHGYATDGNFYVHQIWDSIMDPNPWTVLEFPCSYGSAWTDTLNDNGWLGQNFRSSVVNGFGTLEMPYGTVDNVLRVEEYEYASDWASYWSTTTTSFYKPGIGWPVLVSIEVSTSWYGGGIDRLLWINVNDITGVEEIRTQEIGIDLYPNPANGNTQVVFGAQGHVSIELYDATGRLVQIEEMGKLPPGIHKHGLDLSGLPVGVYTVIVQNDNNERGVKRLVVE